MQSASRKISQTHGRQKDHLLSHGANPQKSRSAQTIQRGAQTKIVGRGHVAAGPGISARISHLFPCGNQLRNQRKSGPKDSPLGRKGVNQRQAISPPGTKKPLERGVGLGSHHRRRRGKSHGTPEKKRRVKNRKNRQKKFYSGKKKRHTLKTQVVVNKADNQILCTDFCEGKKHDFALFKESQVRCGLDTEMLADAGYQGVQNIHSNSRIPKKSTKTKPLSKADKQSNRELSSQRVLVENVIGSVKRFRILAERYRNRGKRFNLRFNLIAAIHNFEI